MLLLKNVIFFATIMSRLILEAMLLLCMSYSTHGFGSLSPSFLPSFLSAHNSPISSDVPGELSTSLFLKIPLFITFTRRREKQDRISFILYPGILSCSAGRNVQIHLIVCPKGFDQIIELRTEGKMPVQCCVCFL